MIALTSEKVESIFIDCLFKDYEDKTTFVKAEGIMMTCGFHPDRLQGHKEEIAGLLAELPDDYKVIGGGGMSFLNACYDKHGNQWTSFHRTMDQLFMLGMAIGKVSCLLPREMWDALPGSMPYYSISE